MRTAVYAVQCSVTGEHDDVNGTARLFRALDKRGTDRLPGLRNVRAYVPDYYSGAEAAVWLAAVDEIIADIERARSKWKERNARRRAAYRAARRVLVAA